MYIKNLAETVDEEMLRKLFGENGSITSIVIMKVHFQPNAEFSTWTAA